MPTGYTAELYDGKEVTVSDFILTCARAFGALVEMRDDPMDAPIPDEFAPSDHYAKKIAEAERRLNELAKMTVATMERSALADYRAAHQRWAERRQKAADRRERYEAMLREVRRWQPPTADHEGLKAFMIEQLESSIKFDCSMDYDDEPTLLPPGAWHVKQIDAAQRDLEYSRKHNAEERQRAAERSQWVKALRESLPVRA